MLEYPPRRPYRITRDGARLLCASTVLAIGGCKVGPDFQHPDTRMPEGWAGSAPDPAAPPGSSRAVETPPDIARWWQEFQDPLLTSLVERAAVNNLSLHQAEARVRQARAGRTIAGAGLWPAVDASAGVSRSRSGGTSTNPTTGATTDVSQTRNLFRAGFDASWEIDVFGGVRRGIEGADAEYITAVEDGRAVLVSLLAEVATAYFDLRGAQQQLATARRNLDAQQQSLFLTTERLRAGLVGGLDVANAEAQIAGTRSRIPTLETTVRQSIYALGVLLGQEPASLLDELTPPAAVPAVPPEVPVGLPSDLLRRRPDIRAAESAVHAATARIGVATADLFPRFSLSGSLGIQGPRAGSLGTANNHSWSIGPSVNWPIFSGGQIRRNIELQRAVQEQTFDAYRQSVLVALQEVEGALVAYAKEQQRRAALADSVAANRRAVDMATQLYTAGRTDFLNVLSAQRSLFEAEDALAQSDRLVATGLVALYKALGGGWEEAGAEASAPQAPVGEPF